jgi:hypothetical protein
MECLRKEEGKSGKSLAAGQPPKKSKGRHRAALLLFVIIAS